MANAVIAIWIIWTVALLVFYHKIFTVYYFRLGRGLFQELFFAAIFGMMMTGLTLYLWWLAAIIIILFGFASARKNSNNAALIGCVILAVIIAVMGIRFRKAMNEEQEAELSGLEDLLDTYVQDDDLPEDSYGTGKAEVKDTVDMETYIDAAIDTYTDIETGPASDAVSSENILKNSDSQYLTRDDLEGFSANDCKLARNELYARHGRKFNSEDLQDYFNSCSWYQGVIEPEDFEESMLNDIEIANRDLIIEYEEEMGYR